MTEGVERPVQRRESLPRAPKVSEQLADRLRAIILGHGMRPGDRLSSEAELISRYGVARGTVREALRLLESEGLIEIRRGREGGILVRRPGIDRIGNSIVVMLTMAEVTVRELIDYRLLIEPEAAAAAARTATDKQRAELRRTVETEPHEELRFHTVLAECSNNSFLRMAVTMLHHGLSSSPSGLHLGGADEDGARHDHYTVLSAVEERDPEQAAQAMAHHLHRFRELLEEQGRLDEEFIPADWWLSRT
ncbi:FCD domain-containing protein [Streptomyces sp. NBC_00075]|uniref:FadR/GntR family transcriptional regulator n=1 Tax=Streptomyces sp. NBC_00075 TaxID=2975641 RepID=UPI0032536810